MPFESSKHPTEAKQEVSEVPTNTALLLDEDAPRSRVKFSGLRWVSTGIIRVFYRRWT